MQLVIGNDQQYYRKTNNGPLPPLTPGTMSTEQQTELTRFPQTAGDDVETGNMGGFASSSTSPSPGVLEIPPEPDIGKGFLKPIPETTPMERMAAAVAAVAVLSALVAMIMEQAAVVIVAGMLSLIVAPYAYYQQTLLTDIRTLKETKKALQEQVNQFERSNQRLTTQIDNMTDSVNHLEEIEQALQVITVAQGQSIETFRKQVHEAKVILARMQQNHRAAVLQNLLTVVFRSDANGDNMIGPEETEELLRNIQNATPNVRIKEDLFRKAVLNQPLAAVIKVVENLLDDTVPKEQQIFEVPPSQ